MTKQNVPAHFPKVLQSDKLEFIFGFLKDLIKPAFWRQI